MIKMLTESETDAGSWLGGGRVRRTCAPQGRAPLLVRTICLGRWFSVRLNFPFGAVDGPLSSHNVRQLDSKLHEGHEGGRDRGANDFEGQQLQVLLPKGDGVALMRSEAEGIEIERHIDQNHPPTRTVGPLGLGSSVDSLPMGCSER